MQPIRSLLALALCAGFSTAQQTLLVGAGQQYATIVAAIAAASPGDTVLAIGGTHTQVLDIDKGIRLVGRGAVLQISTLPSITPVTVHDIPSGQTFAMSGFDLMPGGFGGASFGLLVRDCAGPVALRDLRGNNGQRWSIGVLRVPQLHLASSFLFALSVTDSGVVCEDCLTEPTSGHGARIASGSLTLVDCSVRGGNNVFGQSAVDVTGGALVATRSELRAEPTAATGNPAISTTAGTVLLDPSTTLLPTGGIPAVTGPVVPVVADVQSLVASTNNDVLTVDSHGTAGALFATVVSIAATATATPIGEMWLDPPSAVVFYFATYGAIDRRHGISVPHPPLPAGFVFTVQGVHFANGGPAFTTPSLVVTP